MSGYISQKKLEAARLAQEQAEQERQNQRHQQELDAQYRHQVLSQIRALSRLTSWQRPLYFDQMFPADHGLGDFLRQELPEMHLYRFRVKDFFSGDDCVRVQVTVAWSRRGWEAYEAEHPREAEEERLHAPAPAPANPSQASSSALLWLVLLVVLYLLCRQG